MFVHKIFAFNVDENDARSRFHQHFISIFYLRRSQKHKKHFDMPVLFQLLGSFRLKAVHKHVGEIDPRLLFSNAKSKKIACNRCALKINSLYIYFIFNNKKLFQLNEKWSLKNYFRECIFK
jgi:hypothetical protein